MLVWAYLRIWRTSSIVARGFVGPHAIDVPPDAWLVMPTLLLMYVSSHYRMHTYIRGTYRVSSRDLLQAESLAEKAARWEAQRQVNPNPWAGENRVQF